MVKIGELPKIKLDIRFWTTLYIEKKENSNQNKVNGSGIFWLNRNDLMCDVCVDMWMSV